MATPKWMESFRLYPPTQHPPRQVAAGYIRRKNRRRNLPPRRLGWGGNTRLRSGFILGRRPGGAAGDLISGGASTLKRAKFFYTEFSDEGWYDSQVRYCDLVAL